MIKLNFLLVNQKHFNHFEQFFEKYKNFFDKESIIILYVIDLDGNGIFEYEGIKFNAIMLYENSVWNEVLDFVSLEKNDLKKLSNEDKLITIYDQLTNLEKENINLERLLFRK